MLIIDSHEDLAYNILTFRRDYRRSADETRRRERGSDIPRLNGDTLLGYPDYRKGRVAVVFSTLFAAPWRHRMGEWEKLSYRTSEEAHSIYRRQVDTYRRLTDEHPDEFHLILQSSDLHNTLEDWEKFDEAERAKKDETPEEEKNQEEEPEPAGPSVGLIMLMEGAEGVRSPGELEEWWELGVRLIGPAWAGTRFCGGTGEPGPLTREGYALLEAMGSFGYGLDLSHMDEEAALQALDVYPGTILASHSNAKALLKGIETNRHLTDRLLAGLIERNAVIGVVPYNKFLKPGWSEEDGRDVVSLQAVAAQIDYICQFAGNANQVGLGSDFDGGYGWQSVPGEIDTIADLHKLVPLLAEKGYSDQDIAGVMGRNWANLADRVLGGQS